MPRTAAAAPVSRPRRLLVAAAALLLGTTTALAVAGPAAAHDRLVSSDPAPGATLVEAPAAVTLTFSAEIIPDGTFVRVSADGTDLGDLPLAVDGETVTATLPADLANGSYEVSWQVTSSDGHGIADVLAFTLAVPEPAPVPAPAETPSAEEQAAEEAEAAARAAEEAEAAAAEAAAAQAAEDAAAQAAEEAAAEPTPIAAELPAEDSDDTGTNPLPWIVLSVAVIAVIAWLLTRRGGFDPRNGPPGQH